VFGVPQQITPPIVKGCSPLGQWFSAAGYGCISTPSGWFTGPITGALLLQVCAITGAAKDKIIAAAINEIRVIKPKLQMLKQRG
ncbi:MAG: hypothetical protein VX228_03135, partial [Pseudomonadota bacterium]|nr:hypothetical protein [Pseudomonadota bacterium]